MDIEWEVIRRAFESKVVERRCPACGSEDGWGGGSAVAKLQVVAYESQNGTPPDDPNVIVVPFHCPNCGYTMLFELTALVGRGDASH